MLACYVSPNVGRDEWKRVIAGVMGLVRDRGEPKLVLGDFNAKSALWVGARDARGEYLADWIESLDMVVLNEWGVPTFFREGSRSVIDLTMATQELARRVGDRMVLEKESLSFLRYVVFDVAGACVGGRRYLSQG